MIACDGRKVHTPNYHMSISLLRPLVRAGQRGEGGGRAWRRGRERERWGRVGGDPGGQGGEWSGGMIRQGARQRFGHLWLPWIPHPSLGKLIKGRGRS